MPPPRSMVRRAQVISERAESPQRQADADRDHRDRLEAEVRRLPAELQGPAAASASVAVAALAR
jgi:hypothetical protein